jgi:hypothetical protein
LCARLLHALGVFCDQGVDALAEDFAATFSQEARLSG